MTPFLPHPSEKEEGYYRKDAQQKSELPERHLLLPQLILHVWRHVCPQMSVILRHRILLTKTIRLTAVVKTKHKTQNLTPST